MGSFFEQEETERTEGFRRCQRWSREPTSPFPLFPPVLLSTVAGGQTVIGFVGTVAALSWPLER